MSLLGRFSCSWRGALRVLTLLGALGPVVSLAAPPPEAAPVLPAATKSGDFLPPDQAFRLTVAAASPNRVRLEWVIAPGYYLYQSRLKFATSEPGTTLGAAQLPAGETKHDEYFGDQVVYHNLLTASLPITRAAGSGPLPLSVTYQGCASAGLCYPPITKTFDVKLPSKLAGALTGGAAGTAGGAGGYVSEQDQQANLIRSGSLSAMLALFFLSGLGVAFTGCVLPTVPILSGIIIGQGGKVTTARAFLLSLTYVLGMACTYTLAGALTAASGLQVQALFQRPWIVILFAGLIAAMAASMFGFFTLQMPAFIQTRVADLSNRQRGGTFSGVAVMGMLSALIITACVAPAMIAALAVISQSGNVWRGASALFAMSLGMGSPLLIVGTSAGRVLPRAGMWMDDVKRLAGCMMLAAAAWMLARLMSERQAMLLFVVPALAAVVVLWRFALRASAQRIARVAAVACGLYAAALLVGYTRGATDPLHPLQAASTTAAATPTFLTIHTIAELDRQVQAAASSGRGVMLDFYADWCASCKEMERYTFSDRNVRAGLTRLTLLRADVTANSADDQSLLRRFGIFGPPTIAFYGKDGHEEHAYRVVGFMKADRFATLLSQLGT